MPTSSLGSQELPLTLGNRSFSPHDAQTESTYLRIAEELEKLVKEAEEVVSGFGFPPPRQRSYIEQTSKEIVQVITGGVKKAFKGVEGRQLDG